MINEISAKFLIFTDFFEFIGENWHEAIREFPWYTYPSPNSQNGWSFPNEIFKPQCANFDKIIDAVSFSNTKKL